MIYDAAVLICLAALILAFRHVLALIALVLVLVVAVLISWLSELSVAMVVWVCKRL